MRRQLAQLSRQLAAAGVTNMTACSAPSTSGRLAAECSTPTLRWLASVAGNSTAAAVAAAAAVETATTGGRTTPTAMRRLRQLITNYKQLSKFRLSGLVVATAAAGYAAGSGEQMDWAGLGWTSLGTMLAASSANAWNQVYEVVNDGRMRRTAARPLPSGRMSRGHAVAFAVLAGTGGIWLLAEKTNATTAALGAANIALYAAVYTPLKQLSVVNTWVGAVVGAVPPLMGWAAAAGKVDVGAAILAAGLYFWQMPHFMALAWLCRADYAAGGYRMLSLVDATGRRTAMCALRNCAYLLPLGLLATWLGVTSPYFAYESAFITGGMLLTAAKFASAPTTPNARLLFRASLLHLPAFMAAFLVHRQPNTLTNDGRLQLLRHHLSALGLAQPLAAAEEQALPAPVAGALQQRTLREQQQQQQHGHVPFPLPMPFLPAIPLPDFMLTCPSKAAAQPLDEEEQHEEEEAAGQQQQQPGRQA